MVCITPLIGAILFSGFVSARPHRRDSAEGVEVAVSAPDGTPITDSAELASQTAAEQSMSAPSAQMTDSSNYGYGSAGSNYGNSYDSSSSWVAAATSTSAAYSSYSTPAYGSGQSNWGGSGYDDCVNKCIASYGAPVGSYAPTATSGSSGSSGSSNSGATHTVIVSPSQGVLRYVPFAVNASVGDTVKFMWGANNHTVTKSSQLTPCNKSSDAPFVSGTQNKDFVFTQVVNDTNPTFFYCGTPTHCQQGMFGIINPPSALNSPTSMAGMMSSMSANNSDLSAYAAYSAQQTANEAKAANWGGNIDLANLPAWSHPFVAENVLYTRTFLASNAEVMKDDGSIDLSAADSTPLMIPQDISAALNNAAGTSPTSSSASSTEAVPESTTSVGPSPVGAASAGIPANGGNSLTSPHIVVSIIAAATVLFAM